MRLYHYHYATIVRAGLEIGLIKFAEEEKEFFLPYDRDLARLHRPDDRRVGLWSGEGVWAPEWLRQLIGPTTDFSTLPWEACVFSIQNIA